MGLAQCQACSQCSKQGADLQGRNRDTDVENKHMDTKGGKRRGWW